MKRIIGLAAALIMVILLSFPVVVSGDTTEVDGSILPTISSISPDSGVPGGTYPVTITGTGFSGTPTINLGSGITVNSPATTSSTTITASITISSGATTGARDLSVICAGATGTKSSAFTVNALSFSISAPSGIALGTMVTSNAASGHSTGSVTTNSVSWSVTAIDTSSSNPGYMKAGSNRLSNQLQIGKVSGSYVNAGSSPGLTYTQADTTTLQFYVSQDIATSDLAGAYSITITFTGSPN